MKIPRPKQIKNLADLNLTTETYLQDWSGTKTSTFKDLKAEFVVRRALRDHIDQVCLITSGNAGMAVGAAGKKAKIRVTCLVDSRLPQSIKKQLKDTCSRVIPTDLSDRILQSEDIVRICRQDPSETIWDVTNGTSDALKDMLPKDTYFDYVICPVGSGEMFCGLVDATVERKLKTRIIGITPASPLSKADKLTTPWTPYATKMQKVTSTKKHQVIKVTESEIDEIYSLVKNKIQCEPSSALVWLAFQKVKIPRTAKVLVINSGKGIV